MGAVLLALSAIVGTATAQASPPWESSPFKLTVAVEEVKASFVDVRIALSFPERHVIYAESFRVSAVGKGNSVEAIDVPALVRKPDLLDPSTLVGVYAHSFESVWRLRFASPGDARLRVEYQGCDDKTCFMPQTHTLRFDGVSGRFVETAADDAAAERAGGGEASWFPGLRLTTAGGYLSAAEFLAFLDEAEGKKSPAARGGLSGFLRDPVAFFRAHGLAVTLLLVLAGGILLNLTPCVLPMIPVNLAIIGAGAGTRGRGFAIGSAYGIGIVLVYGGMGWLILRSGLFFGALQSSPWFSLAMALIFGALALALFDVFVIDFARLGGAAGGRRQGVWAALVAGGLSALLAGACVAPVVLAVLLLAGSLVAGGASGAQFLPFVLGLGMALPWPFAGAGLSVLPRPGRWMVRIKQAFGVFVALLALYYGSLAAAGLLEKSDAAREGSILAGDRAAWDAKIAQAKREGKPLFVDFWATWCKNCTAMEQSTFKRAEVKARLDGYVVVKVQAETPDKSPAKEMLQAFGVRGLPGFAVLN